MGRGSGARDHRPRSRAAFGWMEENDHARLSFSGLRESTGPPGTPRAIGMCEPPISEGLRHPERSREKLRSRSNRSARTNALRRALRRRREQPVAGCRAGITECVAHPLMQVTIWRGSNQTGTGRIDEKTDGQHSYPHIHNVLVSPSPMDPPSPHYLPTIAYFSPNSVLTMGSTSPPWSS